MNNTIIGIEKSKRTTCKLYNETDSTIQICRNISPYLIKNCASVNSPTDTQISNLSKMVMGSNAVDGKKLVIEDRDKLTSLIESDANALSFVKEYGYKELVSGKLRWCIWIEDDEKNDAILVPALKRIVEDCQSIA